MKPVSAMIVFAVCIGATTVVSARTPELWDSYTNVRFGYHLCYPSGVFVAQPEADNGDGQMFVAQHSSAVMRVWGSNNALEETLDQKMNATQMWIADPDPRAYPRINYRKRTGNHYIVTGNSRTDDFYEKTYLANGAFISLQIRYPQRQAKYWQAMLPRISGCFKPSHS